VDYHEHYRRAGLKVCRESELIAHENLGWGSPPVLLAITAAPHAPLVLSARPIVQFSHACARGLDPCQVLMSMANVAESHQDPDRNAWGWGLVCESVDPPARVSIAVNAHIGPVIVARHRETDQVREAVRCGGPVVEALQALCHATFGRWWRAALPN
jgi:hypothetical protein